MITEITVNKRKFEIDTDSPLDISMPMIFNGPQPNTYNVPAAASKPYKDGNFIGDTRLGGSCNFEEYTLIPHCNGTHTECIGHITNQRISIYETLKSLFIPSSVVTIQPVSYSQSFDTYDPAFSTGDLIISSASVTKAFSHIDPDFFEAVIIRTLPNDDTKRSRKYMDEPPPFFSTEAMSIIAGSAVKHLLVDIPSVDRAFDEGKLSIHHMYWGLKQGSHEADPENYSHKTITEMVYVPDEIPDGKYFLNLQTAPFVSDACPSRPLLFKIKK
jgi:kynurenine formamidase